MRVTPATATNAAEWSEADWICGWPRDGALVGVPPAPLEVEGDWYTIRTHEDQLLALAGIVERDHAHVGDVRLLLAVAEPARTPPGLGRILGSLVKHAFADAAIESVTAFMRHQDTTLWQTVIDRVTRESDHVPLKDVPHFAPDLDEQRQPQYVEGVLKLKHQVGPLRGAMIRAGAVDIARRKWTIVLQAGPHRT